MHNHQFGGAWTGKKLEFIKKYLNAYQIALKNQPFPKVYIDAFAGTGYRQDKMTASDNSSLFSDEELQELTKGSASVALEVEPAFDRYLFIDSKTEHVRSLQELAKDSPHQNKIQIVQGEANAELLKWCHTKPRNERAVIFLDPYGMQVEWSLMQALAETKTTDVWTLVPIGQAINRLLTKKEMPPKAWAEKLTRFFGTDEWKQAFYRPRSQTNMFETEEYDKHANFDAIADFFIQRLETIFVGVAPTYYLLCNSQNTPLYMICFAASNQIGSKTAVKIANDILRKG